MKKLLIALSLLGASFCSNATLITSTSLTSAGATPNSVSTVGGVVFDVIGLNGTRVISQLSANSLFEGFFTGTPGTIGVQSGWDSSVWGALGGGIAEAAVRLTVYDGDTGAGEFDFNDDTLLVNSINFGNFSNVATQRTSADGTSLLGSATGFLNEELNTGWFYNNNATALIDLYDAIVSTSAVSFQLADTDPTDNYFDFKQGVDSGLINVGSGPQVTPSIPEPATLAIFALGLFGLRVRQLKK